MGTGGYSGVLQVLGVLRGTWGTLQVLQVLWATVGNNGVLLGFHFSGKNFHFGNGMIRKFVA